MANYLDKNGLLYLWGKIKAAFVAKEAGKGLSTNDFTTEAKSKLDGIEAGAQVNVKPDWSAGSGTPSEILNKPTIPSKTSDLENDSGYITADDVPEGAAASSTTPKMDGEANVGIETTFARGDHVHPSDTSKANAADVYTKSEIDEKGFLTSSDIQNKADKATTLAGYGIEDAYTKTEIDSKVSSVYKPGGNKTFEELPEPAEGVRGYVYNVTNEFTTDERFVEGAGKKYPLGTNVLVIEESPSVYKYDTLSGFIDLSGFLKTTDMVAITNEEIDQIVSG